MDKLITFAVPCYNSAAYMDHCVETLLAAGEDAEIILVDDGSTRDDTPAKCDAWAEKHPGIIRAIHQENGGHGEGVNQGIRNARGIYYKVVDSDDWVDVDALHQVLDKLRQFTRDGKPIDLMIANYVYEHVEDNTQRAVNYRNVFPVGRVFNWKHIGRFKPGQYLLMHSVIYRTQILRDCQLELPKHTFYVDNIFVHDPLPHVKNNYTMHEDLYRYFIGRADQSVNESVMMGRVDQQLRVNYHMIDCWNLREVAKKDKRLAKYMYNYLAIMMTISSIFLTMEGSPESLGKRTALWEYLRTVDKGLYTRMRYFSIPAATNLPTLPGRKLSVGLYRLARKIYKFN